MFDCKEDKNGPQKPHISEVCSSKPKTYKMLMYDGEYDE